MRIPLLAGLILTAAAVGFAQRSGAGGAARVGAAAQVPHLNPIGQGNLMFPGQGNIARPGVAGPGRINGRPGSFGVGRGRTVYVPYAVGVDPFYGGYGYAPGYGYGAPYAPYDPNAGYYPGDGYDAGGPTPTVIINQNFQPDTVRPVLRDYSNVPLPPAGAVQTPPGSGNVERLDQNPPAPAVGQGLRDDQPTIFLIAMKDHTIYPVIAYWADKDTLNYVTVESEVKRVPLDQVDRDMSIQLNAQRNLDFHLPAK